MTSRVQTSRQAVTGARPGSRPDGELYTNSADLQFGVVVNSAPQDLLAVRFFSQAATYKAGDHVIQGGFIYRATTDLPAGVFNPAQWTKTSSDQYLPLVGGTMAGPLLLDLDHIGTTDDAVAHRGYVKTIGQGYLPLIGGTLSGVVIAPQYETNAQSVVQSGGTVSIDIRNGQNLDFTLSANVTGIFISGWPTVSGITGRVRMRIVNAGSFTMTGWPAGTVWPNNTAPVISPNGTDIIELTSSNGGATIYGQVIGQAYASVLTAIDGPGGSFARKNASTIAANITTSRTNTIVLAFVHAEAGGGGQSVVSTMTGGGLTWTRRKQLFFVDTYNSVMELWWAAAAPVLNNQTVTATITGGQAQYDAASIQLVAVTGVASLATPWDVNVSLPATQTRPYPSTYNVPVSTTAPHTMLFGFHGANTPYAASPGAGFIGLAQVQASGTDLSTYNYSMYQIFNSPQTNFAATLTANVFGGVIFDALKLT